MPELEYFVVARSVSIDPHSDEITLSGVLEEIELENEASVIPRAVAVAVWNLSDDDAKTDLQAVLRIIRPGETEGVEFPVNLNVRRQRIRGYFAVLDIPLDKQGTLLFEMHLNTRPSAHHRVIILPEGTRLAESDADRDLSNGHQ